MSPELCPQCSQPCTSRWCPNCRSLTPSELLLLNAQSGSYVRSVSKGTALTILSAAFVANHLAGAMSLVVTTRKFPYWTNTMGDVVGAIGFVVRNRKMPYWHRLFTRLVHRLAPSDLATSSTALHIRPNKLHRRWPKLAPPPQ